VRTTICSCLLSLCDSNSTAEGRCLLFICAGQIIQFAGGPGCEIGRAFSRAADLFDALHAVCPQDMCLQHTQPVDVISSSSFES